MERQNLVYIRLALENWEGLDQIQADEWATLRVLLREACGDQGGLLLDSAHNDRDIYLHFKLKLHATIRGIVDSIAAHLQNPSWSAHVDISRFRWSGDFYAQSVGGEPGIPERLEHPWTQSRHERRPASEA